MEATSRSILLAEDFLCKSQGNAFLPTLYQKKDPASCKETSGCACLSHPHPQFLYGACGMEVSFEGNELGIYIGLV